VYGRDEQVRELVFEFIRRLDLCPLEWESLVSQACTTTPSLREVIQLGFSRARAIVVLLTPDDEVRLHSDLQQANDVQHEKSTNMQPRPNVIFELGWALARRPTQTIVVEIGHIRPIADIGGLNTIRLDGSEASWGKIVERLKVAGCPVDDRGADWRRKDRFSSLDAYTRRAGRPHRKRPPTSEGS
jgi:predicted nucleotide-binding protein